MTCYYASLLLQCLQPHRTVFQYTYNTPIHLPGKLHISCSEDTLHHCVTDTLVTCWLIWALATRAKECQREGALIASTHWNGLEWIEFGLLAADQLPGKFFVSVKSCRKGNAILVNDLNSVQRLMRWQKSAQIYGLLSIQLSFSSVSRTVQGQQPHPWPQEPAWESSHTTLYKL